MGGEVDGRGGDGRGGDGRGGDGRFKLQLTVYYKYCTYLPSLSLILMVWKSIGLLTTLKYSGNLALSTGSRNGQLSL